MPSFYLPVRYVVYLQVYAVNHADLLVDLCAAVHQLSPRHVRSSGRQAGRDLPDTAGGAGCRLTLTAAGATTPLTACIGA